MELVGLVRLVGLVGLVDRSYGSNRVNRSWGEAVARTPLKCTVIY